MPDRTLVLHIAVPGINIDDWDDFVSFAKESSFSEEELTAEDMGEAFMMDRMREDVGLTVVTLPGEKCDNDDFMVVSFNGRVIGASLAMPDKRGVLVALTEEDKT